MDFSSVKVNSEFCKPIYNYCLNQAEIGLDEGEVPEKDEDVLVLRLKKEVEKFVKAGFTSISYAADDGYALIKKDGEKYTIQINELDKTVEKKTGISLDTAINNLVDYCATLKKRSLQE